MVNPKKEGVESNGGSKEEIADWTLLPSDLAQRIADRLLVDVTDYIRFRAVCATWRSKTSDPRRIRVPPQLPWLMLTFNEILTNKRSFYRLSDGKTVTFEHKFVAGNRIIGSADGWLVLINELTAMNLFDPLTEDLIRLPPLGSLPDIVGYNEQNVGQEYFIRSFNSDGSVFNNFEDSDMVRDLFVLKVVMSSSEHNTSEEHNTSDRLVMACVQYLWKLVFAKVGDETWTTIESTPIYFTDILYYQGQFYVVDMFGKLMVCDLTPPAKIVYLTTYACLHPSHWYLVESDGNLLVVDRHCISHTHGLSFLRLNFFEVFKVENLNTKPKFVKVESLGDQTLFLGSSQAMSFSASDFPGWRGNRIYFTAGYFILFGGMDFFNFGGEMCYGGDDLGVFNLADGSIDSLPCYPENTQFVWPPPIWFAPTIRQENDYLRKFFSKRLGRPLKELDKSAVKK